MKRLLPWLCLALMTPMYVQAQTALSEAGISAERERLQAAREAIEQAHLARTRECWQRFAVNDCLREMRRSRDAALDPIRRQELALNAQERAWQAEQRDERLRDKAEKLDPGRPAERRP